MRLPTQTSTLPLSLEPQWDLALNTLKAKALELALRENWFAVIDQYHEMSAVADVLQRNPQWLEPVLDLLCGMGFLSALPGSPKKYFVVPEVRHFWLKSSAAYIGDAWLYRYHSLSAFAAGDLGDTQAESPMGKPSEVLRGLWANAAENHLAQEQTAVTGPLAAQLVRNLPEYSRLRSFLDLGGGPGKVAVHIAQASAQVKGSVFDFPEAAEVARAQIAKEGLADQLSVQGGDMEDGNFGGPYDLIWVSSVLHFTADPGRILQHIFDALAPGGVLVSAHAEIPAEYSDMPNTLAWILPLRMRRRSVWPAGTLANQLEALGFNNVETYLQKGFPMAPLTIAVGRRPI